MPLVLPPNLDLAAFGAQPTVLDRHNAFKMQQQENQRQNTLLSLKQQAMQQQAQELALDRQSQLQKVQQEQAQKQALSSFLQNRNNPQAFQSFAQQFPQLALDTQNKLSQMQHRGKPLVDMRGANFGPQQTGDFPNFENDSAGAHIKHYTDEAIGAGQDKMKLKTVNSMFLDFVKSGGTTGAWEPMKNRVKARLGVDLDTVSQAQTINAQFGDFVMDQIQRTKGAVSEKEMAYFAQISPGIDKEPFTNYALLQLGLRKAQRAQLMPGAAIRYIREGRGVPGTPEFDAWFWENIDPWKGEWDIKQVREQWYKETEDPEITKILEGIK